MSQNLSRNWGLVLFAVAALWRSLCQSLIRTPRSTPWRIPEFFKHWRDDFTQMNEGLDPTGLVSSIFLGEDSACPRPILDLFRNQGLSHLLAASGFNCWIVSQTIRLATRPLVRLIGGRVDHWDGVSAIGGAMIFWCWSDQSPPVTRALLTAILSALLRWNGARIPLLRLVFLQYCGSLLIEPSLFRHAGFQLTHACLMGLIGGELVVRRIKPKWPHWVAPTIGGSLGATLAAQPITWIYFAEINFNGLLLTPLVSPLISLGLMPLGLLEMIALLIPEPWGLNIAQMLGWLCARICQGLLFFLQESQHYLPSLRYAPYWD